MRLHFGLLLSFLVLGACAVDKRPTDDNGLPPVPGLMVAQSPERVFVEQDVGVDGHWDWRFVKTKGSAFFEVDRNGDGISDAQLFEREDHQLVARIDSDLQGDWKTYLEPAGEDWLNPPNKTALQDPLADALCVLIGPLYCREGQIPTWRETYQKRLLEGLSTGVAADERGEKLNAYCATSRDIGCGARKDDSDNSAPPVPVVPVAAPTPPVCGPDVTTQITTTLTSIQTRYGALPQARKDSICDTVFSWDRKKYLNAFDIMPLFEYQLCWYANKYPGCDIPAQGPANACEYSIEFAGGCYHSAVANYLQFGLIGQLCGKYRLTLVAYHLAYDATKRFSNLRNGQGNKGDPNLSQQSLMMNLGYKYTSGATGLTDIQNTIAANKRLMTRPGNTHQNYYHCALSCPATALQPDPPPWPFVLNPVFPRGPSGCVIP